MLTILPSFAEGRLWLAIILLIVGLVMIIKGGDWFVDSSVWLAEVLHMPKFLIGATIVSLATTLPEMIVSIIAVSGSNPNYAISVGNAVGSVTANTGLILAISAIFVAGEVKRREFGFKSAIMILAIITTFLFSFFNKSFGIIPSIILAILFIIYMVDTIISAKKSKEESGEEEVKKDGKTVFKNIVLFIVGIAGIVLGADLLVDNAEILAKSIGISDGIIGVTLVAVGTSLPELITTITSIVKKQNELGVGNVIGANIIDLVLILPICSFISGGNLVVVEQSRLLDMPALLVIAFVACIPTIITGKFKRWQGALMLTIYIGYLVLAAIFFK